MMIRGDQHVDDWAEIAVDYLDGQLDHDTRIMVETHLAECPECAARLRRQQYVVSVLQETALDDPPEDLEYRAIGELVFPSPGGRPVAQPAEAKRLYRTPRWYRTVRAWIPATVAVCALLAAVVGYGIAKSNSDANLATDSARTGGTAAAATTAAPSALSEAAGTGSPQDMTTAAPATTTTAGASTLAGAQPNVTFVVTQDPKAMIRALNDAETPVYVAFHAPIDTTGGEPATGTTAAGSETTAPPSGTDTTTAAKTDSTADGGTGTTGPVDGGDITKATLSSDQATALADAIKQFTGLDPLDRTLWISGPTYAVFLPRKDADDLVDLVRSISSTYGLSVTLEGGPPAQAQDVSARLLDQKKMFPVLEANRALQPSTWNYDFTTSTLAPPGQSESLGSTPDADGSHVVLIIWISE